MKKLLIVVSVLLVIGVGAYLLLGMKLQGSNTKTSITQNKSVSKTKSMQEVLKDLMASGKSQKCTYSNKLELVTVSGTIYIAGEKMRGDFTSVSKGNNISGHMIVDSQFTYTWTDVSKRGVKVAINQQPSGGPLNNQALGINKTFSYNCQDWLGDSAMFVPPSDVVFATYMLPSGQPSGVVPSSAQDNASSKCSVCDNLPAGSGKDACKAQLHCN